jgi:TolA-binding protein
MKIYIKPVLLISSSLLLISCSTQQLERDIEKLNSGLKDLRSIQAEQTLKISSLEDQVRQLSGSIEEVQYATDQKLGRTIESMQGDLSSLRKRVPPPSIVPENLLIQDEQSVSALPSELVEPISKGLEALRQGDFNRALAFWDESLDLAIGTDWEVLTQFWRAVCLEGLTRPSEAVQEYVAIIKRNPRSPRAPAALFRQATLLERLGDRKAAQITFNKLISDYPKSSEADVARKALKEL